MKFNIDSDAVVKFANTLEKMYKSAFPSAVRGTLNKTVLHVKTQSMPSTANKNFTNRQPNFFKANSRFEPAKGFNMKAMQATVGFIPNNLKGSNNHAVSDLEEQETGGTIERKSFIPMKAARTGNNQNKVVRSNARLSNIKKIVEVKKMHAKNKRSRFVLAAIAAGKGGFVLSDKILWRIDSDKTKKGGFKKTPLYSFKKGRNVTVNATGFMRTASEESAKLMPYFFEDEANRQIKKLQK